MKDLHLWQRIAAYNIDKPEAVMPFSARLRRDNLWTAAYTTRVITEYKRFMYLACISQQPVTPSKPIDEVWHLHLLYTKAYWQDFCAGVLHREIHHHPTEGGSAERDKYHQLYQNTLALYRDEFGDAPPPDIWLTAVQQPAPNHEMEIDTQTHWRLPKPDKRAASLALLLVVMPLGILLMAASGGGALVSVIFGGICIAILLAVVFVVFSPKQRIPKLTETKTKQPLQGKNKKKKEKRRKKQKTAQKKEIYEPNLDLVDIDTGDGDGNDGDSGGDSSCSSGCSGCGGGD